MKKFVKAGVLMAAAVVGFAIAFAFVPNNKPSPSKPLTNSDIQHVSLLTTGASPSEVYVKLGKSVEFDSKDGKSHNLQLAPPQHSHSTSNDTTYRSGTFKADEAWKATFNEVDSYTFEDTLNPKVSILVVAYKP